jgi:hypothetical protein
MKKTADNVEKQVVADYLDGMRASDVSSKYEIASETVWNILKRKGVTYRHSIKNNTTGKTRGWITPEGYRKCLIGKDHLFRSMATLNGEIYEHRLIMAEHLDRPLEKNETVHHINGNRADNRIENLQITQGRHGNGQKMKCPSCDYEQMVFIRTE